MSRRKEEIMGNKLTRFTKLMLDVMFYAGIVVTLTLPVSVKIYGQINSYFAQYYVHMIIMFGISGILAELSCAGFSVPFWKMTVLSGPM